MDLVLVNPNGRNPTPFSGIEPPLWCGILATYIRDCGYEVSIVDAEAENLTVDETVARIGTPSLAAIVVQGANPSASSTPKMAVIPPLLERLGDVDTILMGLHPSALPMETKFDEKVKYVCQGEGFTTLLGLLAGKPFEQIAGLWPNDPAQLIHDLPDIAWDLLPMDKYRAHNWHCLDDLTARQPYGVTYTSLGCPYNCHYCNVKALYNGKPGIRYRKPDAVVKEIDTLVQKYGVRNIKILDELFAVNEAQVNGICQPLIAANYDLNMWAYARVDSVTPRMLETMKSAGINWLCYGFESVAPDVRLGVGKSYQQDTMPKVVKWTHEAGINIIGNFIFGLPDDDLTTMGLTLQLAKAYELEFVNFYVAVAYPGSRLYTEALRDGKMLPETWADYSQYSKNLVPLGTTTVLPEKVLQVRDEAFQEYYTNPTYLKMIRKKFGIKAANHIKEIVKWKR